MLIQLSLVATALLVVAYIVGSELCLPSARYALHTGRLRSWKVACLLVALGEWAMIVIGLTSLLLAEHLWQPVTGAWPGRLVGLMAAGILAGATVWQLAGRMRRNYVRAMSNSLDLVLPVNGVQRQIYANRHRQLESGSPAEQGQVLQQLFRETRSSGK
ncbi:MAG: hypothetical protein WCH04_10455 [Gammaproteobacteria bacterium]